MSRLFLVDLTDVQTGEKATFVFDAPWSEEMKRGFELGEFSRNRFREYAWQCARGVPNDVSLRIAKKADDAADRRYKVQVKRGGNVLYEDKE